MTARRSILPVLSSLPVLLLLLAACGDAPPDASADGPDLEARAEAGLDEVAEGVRSAAARVRAAVGPVVAEMDAELDSLELLYGGLPAEARREWTELRGEISDNRAEIRAELERLGGATGARAEEVEARIEAEIEASERLLQRARLRAAQGWDDFASRARGDLEELQAELDSLQARARAEGDEVGDETRDALDRLQAEADSLERRLDAEAGDELREARAQVTDALAALAGSVGRLAFRVERELES